MKIFVLCVSLLISTSVFVFGQILHSGLAIVRMDNGSLFKKQCSIEMYPDKILIDFSDVKYELSILFSVSYTKGLIVSDVDVWDHFILTDRNGDYWEFMRMGTKDDGHLPSQIYLQNHNRTGISYSIDIKG